MAGLLGSPWQSGAAVAATTTYSGTTGAFTINLGDTALLVNGADITGDVTNNGTLEFGLTDNLTVSNLISGSGSVLLSSSGTITFSGSNSYLGGTTVRYGDLVITSGGVIYHPLTDLNVGLDSGDNGFFTVAGGSVTDRDGDLGREAGSTGTALVTSGTWANTRDLNVGYLGTGVLTITGGSVTVAGSTLLGRDSGSSGDVIVSGGTLDVEGVLQVGFGGQGTLLVNGGSVFSFAGYIGVNSTSSGTATVTSGTWTIGRDLLVGLQDGPGTLNISSGGVVSVGDTLFRGANGTINLDAGGTLQIGTGTTSGDLATDLTNDGTLIFDRADLSDYVFAIDGSGIVIKRGGGTLWFTGSNSYSGGTTILGGTLQVANGGWIDHASAALDIGSISGDVGGLDNFGGGVVASELSLYNGTFIMSDGTVTTGTAEIGTFGSGTASMSGGTWSILDHLLVGSSGTGTMNVTGGVVTSSEAVLGALGGDSGSATVTTGGVWNSYGNLTVGGGGTGELTISDGGEVLVTGTLSKGASGTINLNANGTLRIGNGGTTGTLATDLTNDGFVIFNRSNAYTYGGEMDGTGAVTKSGAGTLTFSGSSSYTGLTTIEAGEFYIEGQLGETSLTVNPGAFLGGSGTVLGPVFVVGDVTGTAVISPGSLADPYATLTVGSLELTAGSLARLSVSGTDAGVNYDQIAGADPSSGIFYGGDMEIMLSGSYADQTTFHLYTNFSSASGDFNNITLAATGAYASLSGAFAYDISNGVWVTNWTSNNQRLQFSTVTGDLIVVPEPSTVVLGAAGIGLATALRWHRRRRRMASVESANEGSGVA